MKFTQTFPATATRKTRSGMTLLEMLVALGIGTVVFAGIGTLVTFTARSFVALGNYAELDRTSRNALDVISREIRAARAVTAYTPTKLALINNSSNTLVFEWKSNTGLLTKSLGTTTTVLLTECDYLKFNIFQRNPTNNWSWISTTNAPLQTKLVDVSWRCSRQILGQKVNTESVQTAKIVIRN